MCVWGGVLIYILFGGAVGKGGYLGRGQNSPQKDEKNILGNVADLYVKMCATSLKRPFVPSVSFVKHRQRPPTG